MCEKVQDVCYKLIFILVMKNTGGIVNTISGAF